VASGTEYPVLVGPAGPLAVAVDRPAGTSRGVALVTHPHPLYGGTMDNKVVQTLARAHVLAGWTAVRFNFRGVGQSAGSYDQGVGEVDDLLAVQRHVVGDQPWCLAGFSFGAFVAARALTHISKDSLNSLVLVGLAASRFEVPPLAPELQSKTLVLHGDADETVPLQAVLDWARPQSLPVLVLPGVGHFFHGQLPWLRGVVQRHLQSLV